MVNSHGWDGSIDGPLGGISDRLSEPHIYYVTVSSHKVSHGRVGSLQSTVTQRPAYLVRKLMLAMTITTILSA